MVSQKGNLLLEKVKEPQSAAGGGKKAKKGGRRRFSINNSAPSHALSVDRLASGGDKMYTARLGSALTRKTVQLHVAGMGLQVFAKKDKPPTTYLYKSLLSWESTDAGLVVTTDKDGELSFTTSSSVAAEEITKAITEKTTELVRAQQQEASSAHKGTVEEPEGKPGFSAELDGDTVQILVENESVSIKGKGGMAESFKFSEIQSCIPEKDNQLTLTFSGRDDLVLATELGTEIAEAIAKAEEALMALRKQESLDNMKAEGENALKKHAPQPEPPPEPAPKQRRPKRRFSLSAAAQAIGGRRGSVDMSSQMLAAGQQLWPVKQSHIKRAPKQVQMLVGGSSITLFGTRMPCSSKFTVAAFERAAAVTRFAEDNATCGIDPVRTNRRVPRKQQARAAETGGRPGG